jgi:molybdate transport system substrate-binding protein
MSKPGKEIVDKYNKTHESSKIYLTLASSSMLLSKILVSEKGDLYTPGSEYFLEKAEKLGLIKSSRPLLKQTPVIGLSKSGIKKIHNFNDLVSPDIKIALGNPKLTVLGKTFLKMKTKMKPDFVKLLEQNTVVEGINAHQIANYILSDTVDAGMIFDTVAKANNIPYIEIPPQINTTSQAYMVTLKNSKEVQDFINFVYLQKQIFQKYGYELAANKLDGKDINFSKSYLVSFKKLSKDK